RHDWQQSVAARDPWTVFRNDQAWRPNPAIDDGHYTALSGNVSFDTRNDRADPTAGWWLRARIEHSHSRDVTPQAGVPAAVHTPLHWSDGSAAPEDAAGKPTFTLGGPDVVAVGTAGQAWPVGGGAGRRPADRTPTVGS